MGSAPIDMDLSVNSRILFVLLGGTQSVASFRVWENGNLTSIDTAGVDCRLGHRVLGQIAVRQAAPFSAFSKGR